MANRAPRLAQEIVSAFAAKRHSDRMRAQAREVMPAVDAM
jgi:hypothetical protein